MNRPWQRTIGILLILALALAGGLAASAWITPTPTVGVLRFENVIDTQTANHVINVLEAARNDAAIDAVVLEIYSPGGYATSSESIYHTMLKLREVKPLVVSIDTMAASGGYFMAVASNYIYAPASAYVGNVGTRGGRPMDPAIYPEELSSGPYKLSGGSRFDQIRQLDLVGEAFVSSVVFQRTNGVENPLALSAEEVAEARIYLGSEALALGLIDGEGSRTDAIQKAGELAGLTGWQTVDLESWLNMPAPQVLYFELNEAVERMVVQAPPNSLYMLDDRISLPGIVTRDDVMRHLVSLRPDASRSFLPTLPSSSAMPTWAGGN